MPRLLNQRGIICAFARWRSHIGSILPVIGRGAGRTTLVTSYHPLD
jgi:hypothetical protein